MTRDKSFNFEKEHFLWLLAILLLAASITWDWRFINDDAYISLRYVRRLLNGHGLSWNDQYFVEGFTHPAWVFQLSIFGFFIGDLVLVSKLVGVIYGFGIIGIWKLFDCTPWLLFPMVTLTGFSLWAVGGLETIAFSFWLLLAMFLTITSQRDNFNSSLGFSFKNFYLLAGLSFSIASLHRPSALLSGFLVGLWFYWQYSVGDRFADFCKGLLPLPLVYGIFRIWYFSDFLPNSARAKAIGIPMDTRIWMAGQYFEKTIEVWVPLVSLSIYLYVLQRHKNKKLYTLVALTVLPLLLSVVSGGGDHMPAARLLVPILIVLIGGAAYGGLRDLSQKTLNISLIFVALVTFWNSYNHYRKAPQLGGAAAVGPIVGNFLNDTVSDDSLVAVNNAGSVPYFAPRINFVDMLGLNDKVIANRTLRQGDFKTPWQYVPGHSKGDGRYVLRREPDIILLGPAEGYLGKYPRAWFLGDYELLNTDGFFNEYSPYRFYPDLGDRKIINPRLQTITINKKLPITAYLRKGEEKLESLRNMGNAIPYP